MAWSQAYPLLEEPLRYFEENRDMVSASDALVGFHGNYEVAADLNRETNRSYDWIPDPRGRDVWGHDLPGDCENFALFKQRRLSRQHAFPLGALRVCVGSIPGRDENQRPIRVSHAVLLIRFDRGEYLFDNIMNVPYMLGEGIFRPSYRIGVGLTKEVWIRE